MKKDFFLSVLTMCALLFSACSANLNQEYQTNSDLNFETQSSLETELQSDIQNTIYFSMSVSGEEACEFGNFKGCRLFSYDPTSNHIEEVIQTESVVLPYISPSGSQVALRAGADSSVLTASQIYVFDLLNKTWHSISEGNTWNDQGHWPSWGFEGALYFSNTNDCSNGDHGCSKSSLYEDVYRVMDPATVTKTSGVELFLGGSKTTILSEYCSFSNPVFSPKNPALMGVHVSPIDGSGEIQSKKCPFVEGLGGKALTQKAQPIPLIIDLEKALETPNLEQWEQGREYFTFDLSTASINGCAHLDINESGLVTCIEQGTLGNGNQSMKTNKIFGFVREGKEYVNLRPNKEPLFKHVEPSDLPNSKTYWKEGDSCQLYATKYAHSCGEDALLATVQCTGSGGSTKSGYQASFSRIMWINYADPNAPIYIDVTGLAEKQDPDRWPVGTASGFSGTCLL